MKSKRYLLASSAVMAAVLVTSAHAQTKTATTAAAVAEAPVIEELVVTAEKREQSLQDVPLAISAFSGKQRDLIGITSIQDYTNFTPGLVYSTFNDRASMRGIGRLTNIHAVDGAVAIYVDGVYTTSVVLAGNPPIETDRVEVLRGPQGTLYGRNAIGGTINIISPRPTDHPYAEVRAIAENYGFTNYQFAASGPLTEGLKVRLSGYKVDQTQGYYHNVNANMPTEGAKRNEWEYTFQASANLGENVETWIKYESLKWDNRGGPGARSSYLNAPYLWGGRSPLGIDCSGFVQVLYKCIGTWLPRDAYQQAEVGRVINFAEEATLGDLAFFSNEEGKITHVGMILKDKRIIHASGRVRIDTFDHFGIFNADINKYSHQLKIIRRIL